MSKGRLRDEGGRATVQRVLVGVLDGILRLVQPVMPFVAESLWQALNEAAFERGLPAPEPAAESVTVAPWPCFPPEWKDAAVEARIGRMQELVRSVREVRNRYTIDPKTAVDVFVRCGPTAAEDFRALAPFITALAGVGRLESGPDVVKPKQSATCVSGEFEAYVSLAGLIDVKSELARLEKQKAEKLRVLQAARAKLANSNFVDRAPPEVVQQEKDRVNDLQSQIQVIEENLRDLQQA
jgi:valyl-tRNA synthetase